MKVQAVFVLSLVIEIAFGCESCAGDEISVKSNSIRVGDKKFWLQCSDEGIELKHSDFRKGALASGSALSLSFGKNVKVSEMLLANWGRKAIAVIEVSNGDSVEYHAVTFMSTDAFGGLDSNKIVKGLLYTSHNNTELTILSVNGNFEGDGLIVSLAELEEDNGHVYAVNGVLIFDMCPQPASASSATIVQWHGDPKFPHSEP